jgi:hypothetical protein
MYIFCNFFLETLIVRVDGVRLCLRTGATNEPIVHPLGDDSMGMESEGGMILSGENRITQSHFAHHGHELRFPL